MILFSGSNIRGGICMVHVRQVTPKLLFRNQENLQQYLSETFSLSVNENTWMKEWQQLVRRFQLSKFETMSEENIFEFNWNTNRVEKIIKETIKEVEQYFPLEKLNITVVPALPFPWFKNVDRSQWINGFTNGPNNILLAVPPNPDIEFLRYLVAHEAHHAFSENPIYKLTLDTFTLADWLKMEGTAEYFSLMLYQDKRWWRDNFSSEIETHYWMEVKNHLKTTDDQLKGSFCFGDSSKELPLMCGYSFGYKLVKYYIERYPKTDVSELFHIEVEQFFSAYKRKLT